VGSVGPTNPYAAPQSALDTPVPPTGLPADLENAMAGGYDFTIGDVMDEAWRLLDGMKATFWRAAVAVAILYLVGDAILGLVFGMFLSRPPGPVARSFINSVIGALLTPATMGLKMMCVRQALGEPISFSTAFSYFSRTGPALWGALLGLLLGCLGLLALVIPGIYLSFAYVYTTQLVCDQKLSGWKAMETSRRAITHRWWRVVGLQLLVILLTLLSTVVLVFPLIWTIPWTMMTTGVLYRRIFYAPAPADLDPPIPGPASPT